MKKLSLVSAAVVLAGLTYLALSNPSVPEKNNPPASSLNPQESLDFVLACPFVDNDYWLDYIEGIRIADEELGTHTTVIGSPDTDHWEDKMLKSLEEAVEQHPDGILAYTGIYGLEEPLKQAAKEEIPLIALEGDNYPDYRSAFVGTNGYHIGQQAAAEMLDLTDNLGSIGILVSSRDSAHEMKTVQGFLDGIADYDLSPVFIEQASGDPDIAFEKAAQELREHPELTGIFCTSSTNITGAAAQKEMHNLKDLILIGFDSTPENLAYLQRNVIDVLIAQSPQSIGYMAVKTLASIIENNSATVSVTYTLAEVLTSSSCLENDTSKETACTY